MTAFLLAAAAMLALALGLTLPALARKVPVHERAAAGGGRRWSVPAVALALPLAAATLYAALGTPQALLTAPAPAPAAAADAATAASPEIGPAQIEAMVSRLAARLEANPADAEGWRMLARSYETLRRYGAAVEAYRRLMALEPDNPDILADCAVALAMTLDQRLTGEPEKLIARALQIDPSHVQALALLGSAAYERGEYAEAIKPWKKILAMVPAESEIGKSIAINVAKAAVLAAPK
jgi:cytochrome c-type biogenesis protein CcmH